MTHTKTTLSDAPASSPSAPLRFELIAEVAVSPEEILPTLLDHERLTAWVPMLRKVHLAERDGSGVCTARECSFIGMGTLRERITWFDPNRGYGYRVEAGAVPVKDHEAAFIVEPNGTGSRIICTQHFNWKGVFKRVMFKRMMPWMMKKAISDVSKGFGMQSVVVQSRQLLSSRYLLKGKAP